jgi:hypothetical protein
MATRTTDRSGDEAEIRQLVDSRVKALNAKDVNAAIEMTTSAPPRRRLRSTGAVLAGFFAIVALSLGTDQVLHSLGVYPPWAQPMYDPGLNLLALSYRIVCGVLGSYIAAGLAPHAPMRHALILGAIGFVLSLLGAVAAITAALGPSWYPIALVLTAVPCAWLSGTLHRTQRAEA